METIGARIRKSREDLHLTQRELAAKAGYKSHTTLARIENGEVDLPQSRLKKFAEILGVSISYLMGWDDDQDEDLASNKKRWATEVGMIEFTDSEMDALIDYANFILSKREA